ncbi:MAG: hypothetical protein AB7K04_02425 [Pseudorhodoplanes sp.]
MSYRNDRPDYSSYLWIGVFAAGALFLTTLVYTGSNTRTAQNDVDVPTVPVKVR